MAGGQVRYCGPKGEGTQVLRVHVRLGPGECQGSHDYRYGAARQVSRWFRLPYNSPAELSGDDQDPARQGREHKHSRCEQRELAYLVVEPGAPHLAGSPLVFYDPADADGWQ